MTDYTAEDAKQDIEEVQKLLHDHKEKSSWCACERLIVWLAERELLREEQAAIVQKNRKNI